MEPTYEDAAVSLLQSSPPPYVELFNEPDFSYKGFTPLTDAATAAQKLQPVFAAAHPSTTFISPALANANSGWLETFRDNCNNCFTQIPIGKSFRGIPSFQHFKVGLCVTLQC